MNDSKISVRYAKALLQTAIEQKCEDVVKNDVSALVDCIADSNELKAVLDSPVIADSKKIEIFTELFSGKFQKLTMDFLKVLVKNKRENFLKIICLDYLEFYARHKNIRRVKVTSAVGISADIEAKVKEIAGAGASAVELTPELNPDIIGGLIVQIDDKVYDASVRTQLAKIKENLK